MTAQVIHGFLTSLGLIVAIGAQNAFVLKQGILKQHVFWVCLICCLCDIVLMSVGILGLGSIIAQNAIASIVLALLGAVFLFVYGARSLYAAINSKHTLAVSEHQQTTLGRTILMTLSITLLNPHVYIDTVVIVGGIAGTLNLSDKYFFLIGAVLASTLWFFGLGYGARLLTPLFQETKTWRILDALIAVIMWVIAIGLLKYAYVMMMK